MLPHDAGMHPNERDSTGARASPGRAARLLLLRGVRLVAPDDAAGGCAQQAVVPGVMACNSADQRSLDAPLGLRHRRRQHQGDRESHCSADLCHGEILMSMRQ